MISPCACCATQGVLVVLGSILGIVYLFGMLLSMAFPKAKTVSYVYHYITIIVSALVALIAVLFGTIASNESVRRYTFYQFISFMEKYPNPVDELRCHNLKNLSGRVLEIGPGPGTNFRCWQNNTEVTEWVGVEPNDYFKEKIQHETEVFNIGFPTSTVWLKGENVDVEPESFDYVVGSHVLCSVDDVNQVLKQVSRALKPGGTYYFLEHVPAAEGTALLGWQDFFAPLFFVVANGCSFRRLWENLDSNAGLPGFDVTLEHVDAPFPLPLIVPHIVGYATKKLTSEE